MRNFVRKHGWKIFIVLVFLLVPLFVGEGATYPLYVLNLVGIWAIVSLALNLLVGFGGQISIGHAAFLAIGAYTSAIFAEKLDLSFWLALPLSGIFTGLMGFLVGLPAVRLRGHFLAVATLGFGVAIPQIALKWEHLTGGAMGMTPPAPKIGSYSFGPDNVFYYITLVVLILVVFGISNLLKTRPGRAFVAIRDSETAAQAMGINVALYKALLFSVSAFFTGIAGSLFAHFVNYIGPNDFNIESSFLALAMVVVGGVGSIPGSIIGAALLTLVPEWTAGVQGLSITLTGLVLVLVVLFMPDGISGLLVRFKGRIQKTNSSPQPAGQVDHNSLTRSVGGES